VYDFVENCFLFSFSKCFKTKTKLAAFIFVLQQCPMFRIFWKIRNQNKEEFYCIFFFEINLVKLEVDSHFVCYFFFGVEGSAF